MIIAAVKMPHARAMPLSIERLCWHVSCRESASKDHLHPVVFLHGVGGGLLPYIPFLLRTTALGRPVLAVEYKHLSMRWTDHIPTAPQVRDD